MRVGTDTQIVRPEGADLETPDWSEADAAIRASEREEKRLPPYYRHTRLPDGAIVRAILSSVEIGNVSGRDRLMLLFRIIDAGAVKDAGGLTILRSYGIPKPGWVSPNHHLAIDYRAVTGLKCPPVPKKNRLTAFVGTFLKGVEIEALTRLVHRRMDRESRGWVNTAEEDWYSLIDRILEVTAGCPRVLQLRNRSR
jgi:hypothetical protein